MAYDETTYPGTQEEVSAKSPSQSERQKEQARIEAFLRLAKERFKLAEEAEAENRNLALDDLKFSIGEQWPDDIKKDRDGDNRPCLTLNRIPQFKRQITNEQRQQRPSIQVSPVGSGSDKETAEIFQGIIRHIEQNSQADIAYDTAADQMVTSGWGYWKLITEYCDQKTFDQEIRIKRIKNQFRVYFDPTSQEPDYSDADWAFEILDMQKGEYKREFPESQAAALTDFSSIGDNAPGWATKDTIRVAKYYHVEIKKGMLYKLENGQLTTIPPPKESGVLILDARPTTERQVICSLINAVEVLEEDEWPGEYIPIIPCLGEDQDVNGKRFLAGMVRHTKGAQQMYNYSITGAAETIALAPRAPFVGAAGQFKNLEAKWGQANRRNMAYLEYNPVDINGTPAPPPQRQVAEPPIQALAVMIKQADADLRNTSGIPDASLGERGPGESGKAVLLRQKQGDIATFNYSDNFSRAIRFTGRQLIQVIPKVYDAPRVQRIINPDGSTRHVGVFNSQNGTTQEQATLAIMQVDPSIKKIYDLGAGEYDVVVSVGPNYQTARQEAVASQVALVGAAPDLMRYLADMIVRNMDWPQSEEMADRLKTVIMSQFPQLQKSEEVDPKQQIGRLQAMNQQAQQMVQMLTEQVNKMTEELKSDALGEQTKVQIAAMDNASKERIAAINAQASLVQTQAKINAELANAEITAKLQQLQDMIGMAHERAMQAEQNAATAQLADQQAQAAAQQQPTGAEQ